jgi:hypothetical protein
MLDNKINYSKAYLAYCKMPLVKLQDEMRELHNRKYVLYDLEAGEYYRIASRAYNVRTRTGNGLIFHMKNFLGCLLF